MAFVGGLSFDIFQMIDNADIKNVLTSIDNDLLETNGANSDVWEHQREVIYKQYSLRLEDLRSGSVDDVLYANLKQAVIGHMYKAADAAGVPVTAETEKAAYSEFEADLKAGREFLHNDRIEDTFKEAFSARIALWEQQREDGLSGRGYHQATEDTAGHNYVQKGGGFYQSGQFNETLDFSQLNSGVKIDMSKHYGSSESGDFKFVGFRSVEGSNHDDTVKGSKYDDKISGGDGNDFLRGLGGADILSGGDGKDTFVWFRKDIDMQAKQGAVDHVTDFGKEDRLDLSNVFHGGKGRAVDEMVIIKDGDTGSHVYAKTHGQFHEVAILDNVHGMSAAEMLGNGMLLI